MSTTTWVLAGVGAYLGLLVVTLAWLTAAKRGDEDIEALQARLADEPSPQPDALLPLRESPPAVVESSDDLVGRLVADVQGALGVERVAVVLHEVGDPASGVVEACCGVPDLLGRPAVPHPGDGVADSARELLADHTVGRPWRVAAAPLISEQGAVGWVAVGTRAKRFGERDTEFLDRLAQRAARRLVGGAGSRTHW